MKRVVVGLLASILAVGLLASAVEAQKKKKGKSKKAAEAPMSESIAKSMADVQWGMTKSAVADVFVKKIKEKYKPLVAKTHDAVEEDRLRSELRAEIKAVHDGQVEFNGRTTGWDVSFLKGEFSQNNGESMLVVRDENSQNFYFFAGDKLWKWYKAFDSQVFKAGDFGQFAAAVQRRFGDGKEVTGALRAGEESRHWLEWQDKSTRLRAIDQTDFYGFYCLVFEEKSTVNEMAKARPDADKKEASRHALVDSVTGDRTVDPDDAPNIADRITGKMRRVEQAPEDDAPKGKKGKGGRGGSAPAARGVDSDNDPLQGL
jgi:hypothetical protein